jgi:hypothetical protein
MIGALSRRFSPPVVLLGTAVAILSVSSLWVILEGATHEPYVVFQVGDLLVQVVLATILILAWLELAIQGVNAGSGCGRCLSLLS